MEPPWGNGIGDWLLMLAVIIAAIVFGTRIVVQWHTRTPPSVWSILYGIFLLIALMAFQVWFYFLR